LIFFAKPPDSLLRFFVYPGPNLASLKLRKAKRERRTGSGYAPAETKEN
jgi:hypothetical protein